ncbi:MAG: DUF4147 domain-containing protein [Firmicutes bacterium]|nr:DUF4147 domain-containing protein [Bacillota bacterium]
MTWRKIKNHEEILAAGDIEAKKIALEITDKTLQRMDAGDRIKSIMRLEGDWLHVGTESWDLSQKKNIYMIGAGKACNHMAMAVDEILGDRLTRGFAIVKIAEETDYYRNTEVFIGGHPLPNEEGLRACKIILDVVDKATADDLFITLMSGGSSALMACPIPGLTLEDEQVTTDILLKSGANIMEINAIRRHISQTNGGNLAKRIAATGADMIGFSIFDVVGYPRTGDIGIPYPNLTGTPIGVDDTTLDDARRVIRQYDIADKLPAAVVDYLMNCGPEGETPKAFPQFTYFGLNSVSDSCYIAQEIAEEMGLRALVLSTFIEGESRDVGTIMASIAREIQNYGNPVSAPCVVISSGEATTKISHNSLIKGHGGPGQEMTVSFAISAVDAPGACLLSIDTEGTDGSTLIAGGITDSKTYGRAQARGIDFHAALRHHSCYEALMPVGGGVFTGNTGTNVCDFNIMYVPKL